MELFIEILVTCMCGQKKEVVPYVSLRKLDHRSQLQSDSTWATALAADEFLVV